MASNLLIEQVQQEPQSKDVGFILLKGGMVSQPGVMASCIQRLNYWRLQTVILFVCTDALAEAESSAEHWSLFRDFMTAVGQMETLRHLQVKQSDMSSASAITTIPVEWMTALLFQPTQSRLQRLEVSNVRLKGSNEAHTQLNQSIETLVSLKSCSWERVHLLDICKTPYPSESLLKTLMHLPNLKDVVLESPALTNNIPRATIPNHNKLFQNNIIENLKLSLPTNAFGTTLGPLSLAILRSHQLRSLELRIIHSNPTAVVNVAETELQTPMMDLAVAIGSSTSLQSFKLLGDPLSSNVMDPFLVQLARKLQHNASISNLQSLQVSSAASSCRPCVGEAFGKALQSNYSLEEIQIFCRYTVDDGSLNKNEVQTLTQLDHDINFYLALNRGGRKRLLKASVSREEWLEAFSIQAAQKVDILQYYLGANPWLFQPGCAKESNSKSMIVTATAPTENPEQAREMRALEMENQHLRERIALLQQPQQVKKGSKKWGLRRIVRSLRRKKGKSSPFNPGSTTSTQF